MHATCRESEETGKKMMYTDLLSHFNYLYFQSLSQSPRHCQAMLFAFHLALGFGDEVWPPNSQSCTVAHWPSGLVCVISCRSMFREVKKLNISPVGLESRLKSSFLSHIHINKHTKTIKEKVTLTVHNT